MIVILSVVFIFPYEYKSLLLKCLTTTQPPKLIGFRLFLLVLSYVQEQTVVNKLGLTFQQDGIYTSLL